MEPENIAQTVRDTSVLCMDSFMRSPETAMQFHLDGVNEHIKGILSERDAGGGHLISISLRFNTVPVRLHEEGFVSILSVFEKENKEPIP